MRCSTTHCAGRWFLCYCSSLVSCELWQQSVVVVLNVFFVLRCFSRLCSWSSSLHFAHVTTPLSTYLSSFPPFSSVRRHIYSDGTQLFFPYTHLTSSQAFTRHQNARQQMSSRMTENLLTLNSCKTQFCLIGLEKQLTNIHNSLIDSRNFVATWASINRQNRQVYVNYC